jgi:hypothetical protein
MHMLMHITTNACIYNVENLGVRTIAEEVVDC